MHSLLKTTVLCTVSILFSACAMEVTHDSTTIKRVSEIKLASGHPTRIGYTSPQNAWECRELDKLSEFSGLQNVKGMLKFGGAYQVLEEQAIEYANQKHLKPNYIFLYVPDTTQINNINFSAFSKSSATFYQCKTPPASYNKIF